MKFSICQSDPTIEPTRGRNYLASPVNGVKPPGTNCNKRIFDGF